MDEVYTEDESGAGLLELMAALPLLSIMLVSFGLLLALGVRQYTFMISDWQLQREVRFVVERISYDLLTAQAVSQSGGRLRILCSGSEGWVEYRLTSETIPRVMRNSQPMTGESMMGRIKISALEVRESEGHVLFFRVKGENVLTGHEFELESAAIWPGRPSL